jgi:hypothetical protein
VQCCLDDLVDCAYLVRGGDPVGVRATAESLTLIAAVGFCSLDARAATSRAERPPLAWELTAVAGSSCRRLVGPSIEGSSVLGGAVALFGGERAAESVLTSASVGFCGPHVLCG